MPTLKDQIERLEEVTQKLDCNDDATFTATLKKVARAKVLAKPEDAEGRAVQER